VSLRYSISLCHLSWWLLSWLLLHMYILIYVTELYIYIYVYIYIFIMCLLSHLLTGMHLQFVAGFSQRGVRHGCLEGKIGPKQRLEDSGCPNNINRQ
jgi:hypothetical protein